MSLPAIKVGKLAINKKLSCEAQKKGYGSLALEIANTYAYKVLEAGVACRFITVDADIEYDENTPLFHEKNAYKMLATQLGHKSHVISVDLYSHLFESTESDLMDDFNLYMNDIFNSN